MELRIREACADDLNHILHHRRAMFEEMGFRDAGVLESMEEFSRDYFQKALRTGKYKGWMAEDSNGEVVGGGEIVIADWPGYPGENHARRVDSEYVYGAGSATPQGSETTGGDDDRVVPKPGVQRRVTPRKLGRAPGV